MYVCTVYDDGVYHTPGENAWGSESLITQGDVCYRADDKMGVISCCKGV